MVVITHYMGIYFGAPQVVSAVTFSPNLHFTAPPWAGMFEFAYISTGPFGVALFFLISGLVISFSLQKNLAPSFLVGRVFRIFPTYFACLTIGLVTVWLSSRFWRVHFGYSVRDMVTNALLLNNLFKVASIDTVNWTLAVEIKFYLLLALFRPLLLRRTYRTIFAYALLVLVSFIGYATVTGAPLNPPGATALAIATEALLIEMNYIVFMLIGVLFYRHLRGAMTLPQLTLGSLLLLGIFTVAWAIGPQRAQFFVVTLNYYYAYGVFLICCICRRFFRPLALLDFFADISFPLYVVHSLLGYTLLKLAMHYGLGYGAALTGVSGIVILVAWLVHQHIELPSNKFGKRLAARLPQAVALHAPVAASKHG